MSKVFCVILNYNRPEDTAYCAISILRSELPKNTKIVIVDNGSKDLKNYFKKSIPNVIYIKNGFNGGFSAGNNLGIRYALDHKASHILIINPDVVVTRDFLMPMLKTFEDKSYKIGIVGPALTEDGLTFSLGGRINWSIATFKHDNVLKLPNSICKYDFLTFACVLIKREVFEKVGFMDERYFMYLEDVDYCVSSIKLGYSAVLNPHVVVTHSVSRSFDDHRDKLILSFNSCLTFVRKWYTLPASIRPITHALYFYPYTYFLWTINRWRGKMIH